MMINPIETIYKGYRFRSRLEARWAVFFDTLNIPWQYEQEGFDLGGVWYLPDFWLPSYKTWVEVKPTDALIEWDKMIPFVKGMEDQNNHVWIIVGSPWAEFGKYDEGISLEYGVKRFYWISDDVDECDTFTDVFVRCRRCSYIGLEGRFVHFQDLFPYSDGGGSGICCSEKTGWAAAPILKEAYKAARQARF